MASSPFLSSPTPTTTLPTSSSSFQTSFFPKTTQLSLNKKLKKPHYSAPNKAAVSCKVTKNGSQQNPTPSQNNNGDSALNKFDRRDVLIGLGGLYGATSLTGSDPLALAEPISAPDLSLCHLSTINTKDPNYTVYCCPPTSEKVHHFIPPRPSKLRYRPAAHLLTPEYLDKYTKAVQLMRALPKTDPRSFKQQAAIHCAYCNGAYPQASDSTKIIQIHFNWLFFPFHRLYLYFHERILGSLIGDPDFALPFWNWDSDNPAAVAIPSIYTTDIRSPLYDCKRNVDHLPPVVAALDYAGTDTGLLPTDQINVNQTLMRKEVLGATLPTLFFGGAYRKGGDDPNPGGDPETGPAPGYVEAGSHTAIHRWVGDPREDNNEDMGNFYSAGKDTLFYAHHSNVDRLWNIWKDSPETKQKIFRQRDWLEASFVFYDEEQRLVHCKVLDALDTKVLGYDYQPVPTNWLKDDFKQVPKKFRRAAAVKGQARKAVNIRTAVTRGSFPLVLEKIVRVEVPRPKISRTDAEKEAEEEVLVIQNIEFDTTVPIKFDVYINDEDDELPSGPQDSEYAGTFTNIPHGHDGGMKMKTSLVLGISQSLKDLDVEGDETIVVTLVPKVGQVTIGGVKIDYITE